MRLFHLGDLHFGKNIHGYSMIEMDDQPFWAEQLLKKAEELKPDVILISGDVYDRAVPSKEAVKLFDELLTKISEMGIAICVIAGNHDSGTRLSFGEKLLSHQNIFIAGEVEKQIKQITLYDVYGPVHFWLVPYLFPAAVNCVLEREDIKDYDSAMKELLNTADINERERNVILSHQFVIAGSEKPSMGGSETTVGGIGQIDANVFSKFDYVALGHIHNAQRMGKDTVRYAGSPLCYHFSEANQKKGLTIVDLQEKGNISIAIEEMPVLHKMCEVSGSLEEILGYEPEENCYIRAVIKQEVMPPQAVETLRTYFESKNCVLMEVVRDFSYQKRNRTMEQTKDVRTVSLEKLFAEFYQFQHDGELPEEQFDQLITYVAEQTRNGGEDESETERKQATKKLIAFAAKCEA